MILQRCSPFSAVPPTQAAWRTPSTHFHKDPINDTNNLPLFPTTSHLPVITSQPASSWDITIGHIEACQWRQLKESFIIKQQLETLPNKQLLVSLGVTQDCIFSPSFSDRLQQFWAPDLKPQSFSSWKLPFPTHYYGLNTVIRCVTEFSFQDEFTFLDPWFKLEFMFPASSHYLIHILPWVLPTHTLPIFFRNMWAELISATSGELRRKGWASPSNTDLESYCPATTDLVEDVPAQREVTFGSPFQYKQFYD